MKTKFKSVKKLLAVSALSLLFFQNAGAAPADDTVVYQVADKKRVHVEACRRLTKDKAELEKLNKMTYADAKKKGLELCSRCPGSPTPKKEKAEE